MITVTTQVKQWLSNSFAGTTVSDILLTPEPASADNNEDYDDDLAESDMYYDDYFDGSEEEEEE